MKRLLTVDEVATLLAVPRTTCYRWRHARTGPPAVRVGRYLRYDEDELRRWLDRQADRPVA